MTLPDSASTCGKVSPAEGPKPTWRTSRTITTRSLTAFPLIIVEVKAPDQPPDAGTGQVRSYAHWLKPAYYVTTNEDFDVVYNYQGGAVPDVKVLDIKRPELRERFDELYRVVNPAAAKATRQAKLDKLKG